MQPINAQMALRIRIKSWKRNGCRLSRLSVFWAFFRAKLTIIIQINLLKISITSFLTARTD